MGPTGVYWLPLYGALEAAGKEVRMVNGRQTRNLPGRKTDMKDSQWGATLHMHGLLRAGLVPPADMSGSSPIAGVLAPGEKVRQKGLIYTATPASDFICGTLQLAAGMNLHVFTTGRGTPYGLAQCPVVKIATRSDLARRWHDLMDANAGTIATGETTIEKVGWEMFQLVLDAASGRKETWAEHWKLHNALVLFNPAPVT